jgi:predicted transcriptional regulator
MTKKNLPRPTDAELAILGVLWERGPATVREIHDALSEDRTTGYTTVLKFLQIMTAKGLVFRDERQRAHIYRACLSQDETQSQLVGNLLDRAFGGSAKRLVMQALAARPATQEELSQIRKFLDDHERKAR